jgi:hypothetical protein
MAGYNLEFGWDSSSSPNRDDTLAVLAPAYHRYYEVLYFVCMFKSRRVRMLRAPKPCMDLERNPRQGFYSWPTGVSPGNVS